jgi:hypothetical protein
MECPEFNFLAMEGSGADLLLPWRTAKISQGLWLGSIKGKAERGFLIKMRKLIIKAYQTCLWGKQDQKGGGDFLWD